MRRLYLKIYLTIIASLLLVVMVAGGIWRTGWEYSPAGQAFEMVGELVAAALPPGSAPREAQQRAIERLSDRLEVDLGLFDEAHRPIASAGRPVPLPPPRGERGGWVYGHGGPAWSLFLPDGRWIVARPPMRHRAPGLRVLLTLAAIALVIALCAFPFVRGLTRRLERLQTGVETLGAGDLSARVRVEGKDEVARLAASFNRAAGRIEELVGAHRLLLANASHELRTPLSRIRLGLELFQQSGDAKYKADLARDISELDGLVDDILLASRLDANPSITNPEEVDLLALAAEECARYANCTLDGEPLSVRGDPRLLRHLVRNLLENAQRHGTPPVRVAVRRDRSWAVLDVEDRGPGVPEAERERVFTPFHRLRSDSKGAGLGLSLVRQIARLHGGEASVAPRPGVPSCFRVSLPAA
jgi:signal transduction histidine kinase